MLQITATELKLNFNKYLTRACVEDVVITQNGIDIAVLTAPVAKKSIVEQMTGICKDNGKSDKEMLREVLLERENLN